MSYYDDSSLVMIPSGYKTSKVYSQKPTNGTGDLTFTRSNDTASRVGPNGLIERVRTNLALQSQTFDNASWTKDASSITANTIAAPDGTLTAETLTADGTSASHGIRQTGTATLTNGIVYSTSIYAKKGTNNFIQIVGSTAPYVTFNVFANFDLNNGVVGTIGSSVTATIQDAGNGWYRCTMIAAAAATSSTNSFIVQIVSSASAARGESNSLATSVFLWGAQLETSDFGPTPYIPTVAAAVSVGPVANIPRIDYLGGGCGKLLLEPQRTNLALWSESFNNAAWVKIDTAVTANTTISPDGTQNADTMTTTGSTSRVFSTVSTGAGTFTISCYVKRLTGNDNFQLRLVVDGVNQSQNFAVTSEWQRFTFTATAASSITSQQLRSAGAGTGTFAIWGAQFEAGAYATSYIPTLAASVTRGADACSKTGISSLIGQTEGTLYAEANIRANKDSVRALQASDGTVNNRIQLAFIGNNFSPAIVTGGVVQAGITVPFTAGNNKFAIAYANNDVVAYLNGVQVLVDNSATIPTCSVLDVGQSLTANTNTLGDPISQVLVFKTRLTNAQLAELTTL